jgi:membrane associated rhomboid family serine protease
MFNNLTPTVRNLLIINVAVYFLGTVVKMDLSAMFGLRNLLAESFRPYQLVTYMFLHGDIGHLFSNMFGLFMFGSMLERLWGANRFLFFYFFTGIGAGLLYLGINYYDASRLQQAITIYSQHPTPDSFIGFINKYTSGSGAIQLGDFLEKFRADPTNQSLINETIDALKGFYQSQMNIPMVGASGAIFGILMAFGYLFPNTEMMLLFFPVPIKAKYFVTFYGIYELYEGIQRAQGDNVAHFAHLGGMLFAIILLKYWGNDRQKFY